MYFVRHLAILCSVLFVACNSTGRNNKGIAVVKDVDSAPKKPEFPRFESDFTPIQLKFLVRNGGEVCVQVRDSLMKVPLPASIDVAKAADVAKLAAKLCSTEFKWIGYGVAENLNDDSYNELFFANYYALSDFLRRAMEASNIDQSGGPYFMRFNTSLTILDKDRTVVAGPTYNKIMEEYNNKPALRQGFDNFQIWVRDLNAWYARRPAS
jgi:hypothetical protein